MLLNSVHSLKKPTKCSKKPHILSINPTQGQIISLTGLSALSIALWKPNVIVSSLALDFEREENRKVISM